MKDKWYNSEFATALGVGLLVFLVCVGIGSCTRLAFHYNPTIEEPVEAIIERIPN